MNNSLNKLDKISRGPILPLLLTMAIPASVSMLAQSLYNIIDTLFVSWIGENALSGTSIVTPIDMLTSAVGIGLGIGISSWVSRSLGEKNSSKARIFIYNGIVIGIVFSIIFALVGIFFSNAYVNQFSDNQNVVSYATDYMRILCIFSFGCIISQIGFSILQGTGQMIKPMIAQICGVVINTCLDPFLIYGIGPFPRLEVQGAAISTAISETISMCAVLYFVLSKQNKVLRLRRDDIKIKFRVIWNILIVGIPAAMTTIVSSIMTTLLNKMLGSYSPTAIAVYGVFNRINGFLYMPIFGIIRASSSILGYSIGAKNIERFKKTVLCSCVIGAIVYTFGTLIFMIFPNQLLVLFNASSDMLEIGVPCFRILSSSFIIAGISIPMSNCFNPAGKSFLSLSSAFLRQLIFIIPIGYTLSSIGGLSLLWWAFPIADALNMIYVAIIFIVFISVMKNKFQKNQ